MKIKTVTMTPDNARKFVKGTLRDPRPVKLPSSYRRAVYWIANHEGEELMTVALVADLYGKRPEMVKKDVAKARRTKSKS